VTNLPALPEGYFHCQWCKGGVRFSNGPQGTRVWPSSCPHCGMHPHPSPVDETVGGKVDPQKGTRKGRNRRSAQRVVPLSTEPVGQPVLGIDPGYRYVGIVARDGDVVLSATTLVRPAGIDDPFEWAAMVCEESRLILFRDCPAGTKVGVEGVSAPKGFKNGERASLDPKFILFTGVVAGAVFREFKPEEAVIIPPGGNGSQHVTNYPPLLVGRRPESLPGSSNKAGTRAHEQSAYDVAGKAAKEFFPRSDGLASALAM
jgi:hypothetical protein